MRNRYTKELLQPIVESSTSVAEVLRKLGLKQAGGTQRLINSKIRSLSLDTSHFTGSTWAKGKKFGPKPKVSNEELFVENCSYAFNGPRVTKRLIRLGWEHKCSTCSLTEWLSKPIALHVDHINGINNDNRLENLRFLCPNCHQQTPTWGNKKVS